MRCKVKGVYGKLFNEILYEAMHVICDMLCMMISFFCPSLYFSFFFLVLPPLTSFGLRLVIGFPQDSAKVKEVFAKGKYPSRKNWDEIPCKRHLATGKQLN